MSEILPTHPVAQPYQTHHLGADIDAETAMPPIAGPDTARITLLLATYNGAVHLPQQLASFAAQSDPDWDLWISDDGSTDETRTQVETFQRTHG